MKSLAQFLILVFLSPAVFAADSLDSINLGLGGFVPTMPHCDAKVYLAEYEHLTSPNVSVLGRWSGVGYRYDDNMYRESGRLQGVEVGMRHYSADNMQGFFYGGSIGLWSGHWSYTRNVGMISQWQGNSTSKSLRVNIEIGDRIPIGNSSFSVMPEISMGKFITRNSCDYTAPASMIGLSCNQKSEVDYYLFLGVILGAQF